MKQRIWSDRTPDSGAIHAIGNGDFLVYGQGPILSQLQGPPYTAPSFCSVGVKSETPLQCVSVQEKGAVLWQHRLQNENGKKAVFTDGMLPDRAVFFRLFETEFALQLPATPLAGVDVLHMPQLTTGRPGQDCLALRMPAGTNFFTNLAVEQESWLLIAGEGFTLQDNALRLEGSGRVFFSAGTLPDAAQNLSFAMKTPDSALLNAVRSHWAAFFAGITDLGKLLPDTLPDALRQQVSEACYSVAALIKCQQSRSGGEIAGHPYPLGYVRDMAGTLRGMLALGMKKEAAAILRFWKARYDLFGNVHNAEGMGNASARLIFPNDCTELPAYIILSAFHYAEATGDNAILTELWPMLHWAFTAQLSQLGGGMMGFSGDETYIAGGTLPRVHTHNGSAEATLLFWESGTKLLSWARQQAFIPAAQSETWQKMLDEAQQKYRTNFVKDGLLYANNPARLAQIDRPLFTHGFCEAEDVLEHKLKLGWMMYDPACGYYCCPECYGKPHKNIHDRSKQHLLSSVSLLPAFYRTGLLNRQEIAAAAAPYIKMFEQKGFIPSNAEGNRALGYDSGLFLATLSLLRHPQRVQALQSMLDMLDETGAWVEYYDDGVPFNCRCRPWESGINMESIRLLAESCQ